MTTETALAIAPPSGPVAIVPRTFDEAVRMAEYLSTSALVPAFCRKQPHAVFAMVAAGAEMGLAPMASLRALYVQVDREGVLRDGVPRMYADAMVAVCKARPDLCEYFYPVKAECTDTRVVWETKRRGDPGPVRAMWDEARAKKAGLWGKGGPWSAHPARMLSARAKAELAKDIYPDLVGGFLTPEEDGEIIDATFETKATDFKPPPEPVKEEAQAPRGKPGRQAGSGKAPAAAQSASFETATPQTKQPPPPPKEPEIQDAEIVEDRKGPALAAREHYDASAKRVTGNPAIDNDPAPEAPAPDDGFGEEEAPKTATGEPETMTKFRAALDALVAKRPPDPSAELTAIKREYVPWSNQPEGKPYADQMKRLFAEAQAKLRG